ncbi:molybdate ABC transporter permease subunit [Paenibacillus sediminis]|uniref:Molybdenum transport system permease n=1 Tax=Paenibacillus sediminis TaxID=664909 RepID=A0ABS4H126_9BACL|nr:molybdate ABC transporter permease subunit [Paenibacillus sediminis]MBP1935977.1 molybdate transport system permease protein [Paenibacillus sediminis]
MDLLHLSNLIKTIDWESFLTPVWLSLKVSLIASIIVLLLGISAAWWMTNKRFFGKTFVETTFMLPLVLPPTVVGFILLMLLGRRSWIGQSLEWLYGRTVIFSWGAAVIAAVVVSFPLVYQTLKVGFSSVQQDYVDAARSSGASEWQVLRFITLPLSARSLMTAYLLGFARALGEFGATLMIAGNIPGKTQTIPTAIYVAAQSDHMGLAWLWTLGVVIISFILMLVVRKKGEEQH